MPKAICTSSIRAGTSISALTTPTNASTGFNAETGTATATHFAGIQRQSCRHLVITIRRDMIEVGQMWLSLSRKITAAARRCVWLRLS